MDEFLFLALFLEKVFILSDFILKILISIRLFNDYVIEVDIRVKLMIFDNPFHLVLNVIGQSLSSPSSVVLLEINMIIGSGQSLFGSTIIFVEDGLVMRTFTRVVDVDLLNFTAIGLSGVFSLERLLGTLMEVIFSEV